MRQRHAWLTALLVLALPLLACGFLPEFAPAPPPPVAVATATGWPTAARPTRTAPPTATPSPPPTATPAPTWTPRPLPGRLATPEAVADADLIQRTRILDIYADPDIAPALRDWLEAEGQHFDEIGATIERRLQVRLQQRIVLLVQPPSEGRAIRQNCPARGAATRLEDGTLFIWLFADSETALAQREAVVAHEIAHQAIRTKLGEGGDTILNEGLANWAIPAYWRDWQAAPSFDAFVIESIADGRFVPLTETVERNLATPTPGEDCFDTRDQIYNEWASFVDYLLREYGWRAVERFWQQGNGRMRDDYDYRIGFGKPLAELEREWLAQLGRGST